MGIEIRYEPPYTGSFIYSVQRRRDGVFFDFDQGAFRPIRGHRSRSATAPLARCRRRRHCRVSRGRNVYRYTYVYFASFDHMEIGKEYIVRIHEAGRGRVIAELPLTATPADCGPTAAVPVRGIPHTKVGHRRDKAAKPAGLSHPLYDRDHDG